MNIYSFASLLALIVCVVLGLFVLFKKKSKRLNQSFAVATICMGLWSSFPFLVSSVHNPQDRLFFSRLIYIFAMFTPSTFLHFIFIMLNIHKKKNEKRLLALAYLNSIIFSTVLVPNPNFITGVNVFAPYFAPEAGILFIVFLFFFTTFCGYTVIEAFKIYIKTASYERNRLRYLFLAFAFAYTGGLIHFSATYFHKEPFPHDFFIIIYTVIITYSILKYRLMDVKVAITRTTVFISVYTLILGLPFAIATSFRIWLIQKFAALWWTVPLGLMGVLATVGPFIYIYLERKAEDKLLKEQRSYQMTLKEASVGMTRIRNLRKLLDLITHIVTKTVKISYAAIYLYNQEAKEYVLQVMRDKDRTPVPKISANNPLIAWITVQREPLIYEEVRRKMEDTGDATYKHLEENMRLLTASVIIPSFLEDRFMGFFVLGDKTSGQIYTPDDLSVFEVLASQAALAIENAQFYEEAKEMQEQIAQAEKMATIGTMADGLSHQINNRFYALSLIAGDTIDTIKMTDTSKCTPEIKDMVGQINHALERIQSNVIQGGQVVQGLLKYSRKSDSSFEALELNAILNNTLEMVQYKVRLSEIDIVRDFPDDTPRIKGNMAQLQEVFFNFIDNAYDAIVERRNELKEEGYRGKITISAYPKDSILEILVQDNGMGVKGANHDKIFTPFFTTKSSARKGTGLGLYVIKRIITEMHKGRITFESEYKVGTKFSLELPIAR